MPRAKTASQQCARENCRNAVRVDSPSFPYCYLHAEAVEFDYQQFSGDAQLPVWNSLPRIVRPRIGDAGFTISDAPRISKLYSQFLGMSYEDAYDVTTGVADWKGDTDLLIPIQAEHRLRDSVDGLSKSLRDRGIKPGRLSRLRLTGCARSAYQFGNSGQEHGWRRHYDEEATREVLVLDHDRSNPIVIDPVISAYAPVKQRDESVRGKFDDGTTPFTEEVWIDRLPSYLSNPYISWDSSRTVRWQDR